MPLLWLGKRLRRWRRLREVSVHSSFAHRSTGFLFGNSVIFVISCFCCGL